MSRYCRCRFLWLPENAPVAQKGGDPDEAEGHHGVKRRTLENLGSKGAGISDASKNTIGSILETRECVNHLDAVSDALYAIGGKWKLRIIVSLTDGSKRFNELQRLITGISARVLSNELKDMELNGFVKRTVASEHPSIVVYELMPYSESLKQVIHSLAVWGASHKEKIMRDAAQQAATWARHVSGASLAPSTSAGA